MNLSSTLTLFSSCGRYDPPGWGTDRSGGAMAFELTLTFHCPFFAHQHAPSGTLTRRNMGPGSRQPSVSIDSASLGLSMNVSVLTLVLPSMSMGSLGQLYQPSNFGRETLGKYWYDQRGSNLGFAPSSTHKTQAFIPKRDADGS